MLILFLLIFSQVQAADSFPTGCLAEKANLDQACTMLKKVKSTDTLVFATGETMKGCFLMTKNPEEVGDQEKFNRLSFLVRRLLLTKAPFANSNSLLFTHLSFPRDLLSSRFSHLFTNAEKELIQSYISANPIETKNMFAKKIDFKDEFESSKRLFLEMIKIKISDSKASGSLSKVISSVKASSSEESSPIALSCRPDTNAFFHSREVRFGGGMSQYPYLSRLSIFGHEIAHSIDSKWYAEYTGTTKHPLTGLINCLRDGSGQFKQKLRIEIFNGPRHTREAFCDHIGSELVAEHLKLNPPKYPFKSAPVPAPAGQVFLPPGYEILSFDLDRYCSDPGGGGDSHPSSYKRIKEIYLRNPTIAKALNCPTDQQECDLNGPVKPLPSSTPSMIERWNQFLQWQR